MLTLQESFGQLKGLRLAYLGDGNNICTSLILQGAAHGLHVVVASPEGLSARTRYRHPGVMAGGRIGRFCRSVTDDPFAARQDADAVYTDVHVSMGMADSAARAVALAPYKVTPEIMAVAKPGAIFMHACRCTGARRWRRRSPTARNRSSSTRPRTGCTRTRRC